MKLLFRKVYLDGYDATKLRLAVENLFDDYYYKLSIVKNASDLYFRNEIMYKPEKWTKGKNRDLTSDIVEKKEKVEKYVKRFEAKIEILLNETLTDEEITIYKYSIVGREKDNVIMDRICKYDKAYYLIKKSCYLKIALEFNLVNGFTKDVFETIRLFD